MDNILTRLNWKILLGLAIVVLIIIGFTIWSSISSNKTVPSKPTPIPTVLTSWQTYTDPDYQISYPSNLSATVSPVSGGGKSFRLTAVSYNIELQIVSAKQTSVEIITKIFNSFNYQQSEVLVDGHPAKKFTGFLKLGSENFQETAVVLENQGQIYKWELKYSGSSRNNEADNTFDQILNSFHFPKTSVSQ